MPSNSFQEWGSVRITALDEIEEAHRSVGGTGPGRRVATQQINQAYAVLLSSQFQGFCRDLHSECIEHFVRGVALASAQLVLYDEFLLNRRLDRGNPNPGNIGADFNRLGVNFWPLVVADDARNEQRRALLEELNEWRNAIAHQDFDPARLGGKTTIQLREVRAWRAACHALAQSFDQVMQDHLQKEVGTSPW